MSYLATEPVSMMPRRGSATTGTREETSSGSASVQYGTVQVYRASYNSTIQVYRTGYTFTVQVYRTSYDSTVQVYITGYNIAVQVYRTGYNSTVQVYLGGPQHRHQQDDAACTELLTSGKISLFSCLLISRH